MTVTWEPVGDDSSRFEVLLLHAPQGVADFNQVVACDWRDDGSGTIPGDLLSTWAASELRRIEVTRYRTQRRMLGDTLLFFIATFAGLVFLRRGAARWPKDDASLMAFTKTLSRPLAASVLVGLIPTPWIYPRAPSVILKIAGVLIIIATLHVLSPLVTTLQLMGEAARDRVAEMFDERLVIESTLADYRNLLEKRVTNAGSTAAA